MEDIPDAQLSIPIPTEQTSDTYSMDASTIPLSISTSMTGQEFRASPSSSIEPLLDGSDRVVPIADYKLDQSLSHEISFSSQIYRSLSDCDALMDDLDYPSDDEDDCL